MYYLKSLIAAAVLVASASWSHAEQSPSANELVVEASRLIMSAENAPAPEQAIRLLEAAHRQLVLIIEAHPSSDLAVKLATGQGVGTVSLAGVQAAIKAATEQCWTTLSLPCVAQLTLDALMSEEEENRFPLLSLHNFITIASAQMKAGDSGGVQETLKKATAGPRRKHFKHVMAAPYLEIACTSLRSSPSSKPRRGSSALPSRPPHRLTLSKDALTPSWMSLRYRPKWAMSPTPERRLSVPPTPPGRFKTRPTGRRRLMRSPPHT